MARTTTATDRPMKETRGRAYLREAHARKELETAHAQELLCARVAVVSTVQQHLQRQELKPAILLHTMMRTVMDHRTRIHHASAIREKHDCVISQIIPNASQKERAVRAIMIWKHASAAEAHASGRDAARHNMARDTQHLNSVTLLIMTATEKSMMAVQTSTTPAKLHAKEMGIITSAAHHAAVETISKKNPHGIPVSGEPKCAPTRISEEV